LINQANKIHSICGVQAWRVQVLANYDFGDITYGLTFLGASTVFELQLGVVVASIPVVSPAFRNATFGFDSLASRITVWIRGRTTSNTLSNPESSSLTELTSPNKPTESQVDRKNFKKLYEHMYPMSDLDGRSQVDTHVAANPSAIDENDRRELSGNIEVTKVWQVKYKAGD
jgi:hypothetical protein